MELTTIKPELALIKSKIYEIRGVKVMLDFDLAEIYGVETKVLNQSVKRNIDRFPSDFMFQLNKFEDIYHILDELSAHKKELEKPQNRIGFKVN